MAQQVNRSKEVETRQQHHRSSSGTRRRNTSHGPWKRKGPLISGKPSSSSHSSFHPVIHPSLRRGVFPRVAASSGLLPASSSFGSRPFHGWNAWFAGPLPHLRVHESPAFQNTSHHSWASPKSTAGPKAEGLLTRLRLRTEVQTCVNKDLGHRSKRLEDHSLPGISVLPT